MLSNESDLARILERGGRERLVETQIFVCI